MRLASLLLAVTVLVGCRIAEPLPCSRADDCPSGFCVSGRCEPVGDGPDAGSTALRYLDVPYRSTDARKPSEGPSCEGAVPPSPDHVALNEVLVNVPTGERGDANGDGVRDPYDDEFVELVNLADAPVDMSRVHISSGERLRFAFGSYCLPPGESVVVFGGGSIGGELVGNTIVSPERLGFGNDGGRVAVTGPEGAIGILEYGRAPPASYTRSPEPGGARWVDHRSVSERLFSPGRCARGGALPVGCHNGPDRDAGVAAEQ